MDRMKKIAISDATLRSGTDMTFREKLEVLRLAAASGADVVELGKISPSDRGAMLFCRTAAALAGGCVISVEADTAEGIEAAASALSGAARGRISVALPLSTVQAEYTYHIKPDVITSKISELVRAASQVCADVEFRALDALRADPSVLDAAFAAASEAGALLFTLCDGTGEFLPSEVADAASRLLSLPAAGSDVRVGAEISDRLGTSVASSVEAARAGASQIVCSFTETACPVCLFAEFTAARQQTLGAVCGLDMTKLRHTAEKIRKTASGTGTAAKSAEASAASGDGRVEAGASPEQVAEAVRLLGYDLSYDDQAKVYSSFVKLAGQTGKKSISSKELDAIVASNAMQVAPTYKLDTYVINSGNTISSTAFITLDRRGEKLTGFCVGDGPIDAAFLAIEQIAGHHFELDDFQIQAVTEGREAMGDALVRLRDGGNLYSGKGLSTDIIGASIMAYLNALNKIAYNQKQ